MKVLMVTPHLPPHQAANALLPYLLGRSLAQRGNEVRYLTFGDDRDGDEITFIRRRSSRLRATRVPQALEAAETWLKGDAPVKACDVVHIHSNTWMNQIAARLAVRHGKPYVLTHYGTEIWHHDGKDAAFHRLNEKAHHVTFYSQALLERGRELGVPFRAASVVYPPVDDVFHPPSVEAREEVRRRYLPKEGFLLLNVKRLHPLADQATLLEAVARVRQKHNNAILLIAGSGEAEVDLRSRAARLGLGEAVRFLGLIPNEEVALLQGAADLFVLSSLLEATPTVALEALASGTPVLSTDNPGGLELQRLFTDDVGVVPQRDPDALAAAILGFLESPRRAQPRSARLIEERFRLPGVVERYLALYREAVGA